VVLWRGALRTVRVVESAQEMLKPISDPVGEAAIITQLRPTLAKAESGNVVLQIEEWGGHIGEGPDDWALGFQIEVLRGAEVVASGEGLYPMVEKGMIVDFIISPHVSFPLRWSRPPPTADDLQREDWSIRLRGDPRVAIRDLWRSSYWAGVVHVPARLSLDRPAWP
jgi:hypothetical protein